MGQPIDWNTADIKQKTIYPSTDCFHARLPGDAFCLLCGKPWGEIEREGKARQLLEDMKRKQD